MNKTELQSEPQIIDAEIDEPIKAEDNSAGAAVFNAGAVEVCEAKGG